MTCYENESSYSHYNIIMQCTDCSSVSDQVKVAWVAKATTVFTRNDAAASINFTAVQGVRLGRCL